MCPQFSPAIWPSSVSSRLIVLSHSGSLFSAVISSATHRSHTLWRSSAARLPGTPAQQSARYHFWPRNRQAHQDRTSARFHRHCSRLTFFIWNIFQSARWAFKPFNPPMVPFAGLAELVTHFAQCGHTTGRARHRRNHRNSLRASRDFGANSGLLGFPQVSTAVSFQGGFRIGRDVFFRVAAIYFFSVFIHVRRIVVEIRYFVKPPTNDWHRRNGALVGTASDTRIAIPARLGV